MGLLFVNISTGSMKNKISLTQHPAKQVACPGAKVEMSVATTDPDFSKNNGLKMG